jgi:thymidylate synthase
MAKIFTEDRIVPTWLAAARGLSVAGGSGKNWILEICDPTALTAKDRTVISRVDAALRSATDTTVKTVAATIFPQSVYQAHGRPDFYGVYLKTIRRAKKKGTWGTYAWRMMERRTAEPGKTINPLEQVIEKLKRASTVGKRYKSNYELATMSPADDLDLPIDIAAELPTYDASRDGACVANIPCLSHLSFKLGDADDVHLTAIYRSHYYCERALGNLIGLAQLLNFVADETELGVGSLTCVSTHAVLDMKAWGGVAQGRTLLKGL